MHRGEAGSEHLPAVRGAGEDRLLLGLVFAGEAAMGVEMPGWMNVQVNPARRNRQAREIVSDRSLRWCSSDARNLFPFDDDEGVVENFAFAIENGRGFQNGGSFLGDQKSRCGKKRGQSEADREFQT